MAEIPPTQPETVVILKSFDNDKIVINDGDEDEKIVNSDSEDDNINVGSDVDTVNYNMSNTETADYNPPDHLDQNVWRRKKKKSRNIYTHPYRTMSLSNAAKKVVEKYKYRSKKFKTFQPTLNVEAQIPRPEVTVTGQPPLKHPSNIYIKMMKTTKVVLPPLPESGPVPGPPAT